MRPASPSPFHSKPFRVVLTAAVLILGTTFFVGVPTYPKKSPGISSRIVGPSSCAECHVEEFETWEESSHQRGSKLLTRNKDAQKIARGLGIRRIKSAKRCSVCHYTMQGESEDSSKSIAGVSCESCHGGAVNWLDVHDDFGGPDTTRKVETVEHRSQRESECSSMGMLLPSQTYSIAGKCFDCHVVADEELVAAGHVDGSSFELVSFMSGEVRHNFVSHESGDNAHASIERRRELYVIGKLLELKFSLLALQNAQEDGEYANGMIAWAERSVLSLKTITEALALAELVAVQQALAGVELSRGMDASVVVGKIDECGPQLQGHAKLAALDQIDHLLPTEGQFVGTPAR